MKIVAQSGKRFLLVHAGAKLGDSKAPATQVNLETGEVFSPFPIGSYIKRGYWYDISADQATQDMVLALASKPPGKQSGLFEEPPK